MEEAKQFGTRLRELRIQAHLTQRQLAERVGIDFSYLSKLENGVLPPPSEKLLLRLAEVLNADKDELITLAGKIPSDIAQILKDREALQLLRVDHARKARALRRKEKAVHLMKGVKDLTEVARVRTVPVIFRNFARVAIAITLVIAIGTSLWYASPTKALEITFPTLPSSGTLGSTYTFTVTVTIEDNELLPIQSVNLYIYKSDARATYEATLTNLPLNAGSKSYTSAQTGGSGAVSVTATAASGWGYSYGYGYAVWQSIAQYFGYGYGYGYGAGATSMTYSVTWTSPSGWPAGDYKIDAKLTADSTEFTTTSSAFSLSVAAEEGDPWVPPVVVVVPPEPGVTDITDVITPDGEFTEDVTAASEDGNVELTISEGTTGLDADGQPLTEISITEIADPPAPPVDSNVIGLNYDLGPDGAMFDPGITLTFTYDPNEIPPPPFNPDDLVIAFWDGAQWVNLPGPFTIDPETNTISTDVTHFTAFTVLAYTRPAAFVATDLTITPAEVDIGESVTISVLVTNSGDLTGSYEVTLKIDGVVVATEEVTLAGGASEKVTFATAKDVAETYAVTVDGLTGAFVVKVVAIAPPPPAPAEFVVSNLAIRPTEVLTGEPVTTSATVANIGEVEGTYIVTLKINQVVETTKEVTLAGGADTTVTFTVTREIAGSYSVVVDGLSGSFTVAVPPVIPPPTNWWLIGGLIAAAIIGIITWFILRRRR